MTRYGNVGRVVSNMFILCNDNVRDAGLGNVKAAVGEAAWMTGD